MTRALVGASFDAMVTGASIMISNLAAGTEVKTGEDPDTQKAAKVVVESDRVRWPILGIGRSRRECRADSAVAKDIEQTAERVADIEAPDAPWFGRWAIFDRNTFFSQFPINLIEIVHFD